MRNWARCNWMRKWKWNLFQCSGVDERTGRRRALPPSHNRWPSRARLRPDHWWLSTPVTHQSLTLNVTYIAQVHSRGTDYIGRSVCFASDLISRLCFLVMLSNTVIKTSVNYLPLKPAALFPVPVIYVVLIYFRFSKWMQIYFILT